MSAEKVLAQVARLEARLAACSLRRMPVQNVVPWVVAPTPDDAALIAMSFNALPALLELKRAAAEWAADREKGHNLILEHRLAELALVVLEGIQ